MTIDEALAQFESWKQEIADDPEKFAEIAREHSDDEESAPNGGDLGFVTRVKQLPPQLDDVVFVKNPVPGCYGPVKSKKGIHLVYLHSCGEPMSTTEAILSPPGKTINLPGRERS